MSVVGTFEVERKIKVAGKMDRSRAFVIHNLTFLSVIISSTFRKDHWN